MQIFISFVLIAVASLIFYMSFPQQQLLQTPLPARATRITYLISLVIGAVLISQVLEFHVGVFMVILFSMLWLMIIPVLVQINSRRHG